MFTWLFAVADTTAGLVLAGALMRFFALGPGGRCTPTPLAGALAPLIGGLLLPVSLTAALTVYAGAFLVGGLGLLAARTETRGQPLADAIDEPAAGSDHTAS